MSARRRDLLRAAAAVGLTLPLAARQAGPPPALAQGGGDRALLEQAIALELKLVAAYGRARGFDPAERYRRHCLKHVRGLSELLQNRGGRPPAPQASTGQPQRPQALLGFETEAVAALYRAQGELDDPELLPIFASIMGNHAQHQAVLRQRLGREPASLAFETGDGG